MFFGYDWTLGEYETCTIGAPSYGEYECGFGADSLSLGDYECGFDADSPSLGEYECGCDYDWSDL